MAEYEKFLDTLERGIGIFAKVAGDLRKRKENRLPGEEVFKLYDTYGFPLDLTRELAEEEGLDLDMDGFERAMKLQKRRAREKSYFFDATLTENWEVYRESRSSEFLGYEYLQTESRILRWRKTDEKTEIVLDRTPFYPEAGGQVGDKGYLVSPGFKVRVEDTQRFQDFIVHVGELKDGSVADEPVKAVVDAERRNAIERAHTATHLLHNTLRNVLGKDTRQEGSLVEEDRLRFDFTCHRPLSTEELKQIEQSVNQKILDRHSVEVFKATHDEAVREGAIALFGEKYGEEVRVVKVGGFSIELCAGTHLSNSSEVGFFKIVKEEPVAAGIRRLEALTGREAHAFVAQKESILNDLSSALKAPVQKLGERASKLLQEKKQLEGDVRELQSLVVQFLTEELIEKALILNGFTLIISRIDLKSVEHLKILADRIRERVDERLLGVLASPIEGRAKFLAFVSNDLKKRHPASSIAKEIARMVEGGGGGRPTIAEAGGKDPEAINDTLTQIGSWIQAKIGCQ